MAASSAEILPAEQSVQVVARPAAGLYWPAGQFKQVLEPAVFWYWPPVQSSQVDAALLLENWPVEQLAQLDAPASAYLPAGQATHVEAPAELAYLSNKRSVERLPASVYVLTGALSSSKKI